MRSLDLTKATHFLLLMAWSLVLLIICDGLAVYEVRGRFTLGDVSIFYLLVLLFLAVFALAFARSRRKYPAAPKPAPLPSLLQSGWVGLAFLTFMCVMAALHLGKSRVASPAPDALSTESVLDGIRFAMGQLWIGFVLFVSATANTGKKEIWGKKRCQESAGKAGEE